MLGCHYLDSPEIADVAEGLAVIVVVLTAVALYAEEPPRPRIGDKIADLRFKDIRYLPRSLADLGESKATVLVFTEHDLPAGAEVLAEAEATRRGSIGAGGAVCQRECRGG